MTNRPVIQQTEPEDPSPPASSSNACLTAPSPDIESGNNSAAFAAADPESRRLSTYRSLMLANICHELRTPLTAILGFAEILLDYEKLTKSQRELCERIQNSGRQLQGTIMLLSDLSRLDLNESTIAANEFSLDDTLRESCAVIAPRAKKKDVVLSCNPGDELSNIVSDEARLRQSLHNFLAYAIARSPRGGCVRVSAGMNEASEFLVTIKDEGEPIDLSSAFDLSCPASGGEDPSVQELGLDISRQLIAALGGTVTLQNLEPRGLSIMLKLPVQPAPK